MLIPANPSKGRIIKDGTYYINDLPLNETDFNSDPEYPRTTSRVEELVADDSDAVLCCKCAQIKAQWPQQNKIIIPDAGSREDIIAWGAAFLNSKFLLAGGTDFFKELVTLKFNIEPDSYDLPNPDLVTIKSHFIVGSISNSSLETVKILADKGVSIHRISLELLINYPYEELFDLFRTAILNESDEATQVVWTGPKQQVTDADLRKKIIELLTAIAKLITTYKKAPVHLLIEGGETASMFIRKMNWKNLKVEKTYKEGAVTLINESNHQVLTIKPGSYQWPVEFLK